MHGDYLGYFEKHHISSKNYFGSFLATFGKIGLLLIPTSGHTSCELKLILSFTQNRDEGSSAKNKTFLGRALGRSDAILSGQCYKAHTIFNYNQCGQILQNFSLYVVFTVVRFIKNVGSFHYELNIFCFLKCNNLLLKTDQCERDLSRKISIYAL